MTNLGQDIDTVLDSMEDSKLTTKTLKEKDQQSDSGASSSTRSGEPACDGTLTADNKLALSGICEPYYLEMPDRQEPLEVDLRDKDCPDHWVKRHPDLVRLTGRHPFNVEPPLYKLQEAGWITPPSLHVVRDHGAVPRLRWEDHRLEISGVPKGNLSLSMDEIASGKCGEIASICVTFICAGNRRKEQNMTKKTVGFNWGCAAVGNSVWTGIRLCDLLNYLGIHKATREHRYVHFSGPLGELPQGADGSYGTSIDIGWALDREREVLLAYKQNGEVLTPDHGFPLRTLLPGCIGGRMIKWLCKMWVSDRPSESHYHFFDNRVLPPHVDAEKANAEGWWYKPDYIINHMNINSAMFEPRHNSFVHLDGPKALKTLKVCGYAYTGGGHQIIRAEISLDSGKSWEITTLNRPEDAIAAARGTDKYWCWAWWETEVSMDRLLKADEICCRAFDSNQNSQPFQLTWNVMGMCSNTIFRNKIHRLKNEQGQEILWFEHPTMPGVETGGWMTPEAGIYDPTIAQPANPGKNGVDPNLKVAAVWAGTKVDAAGSKANADGTQKKEELPSVAGKLVQSTKEWLTKGIPMSEVEKHNDMNSCWFVVNNKVYDGTPYLHDHPGGPSSMLLVAGDEASEDFDAVHSLKAWKQLEDYYMGPLRVGGEEEKPATPPATLPPLAEERGARATTRGNKNRHRSRSSRFKTWLSRQIFGAPRQEIALNKVELAPIEQPKAPAVAPVFLNVRKMQQLPLTDKIIVSPDTRIFRFSLPDPNMRLGLPTGMHIFLRADINGQRVQRPYTPMTDDATLGHVDLLVKVYFPNVHPAFPEGGKMSQHLDRMAIGDMIDVKGPLGEVTYKGNGNFTYLMEDKQATRFNMVAGGTGLTPVYQVMNAIARDPTDKTEVCLLYANRSPDDILMKHRLDQLAKENPNRLKITYTVDRVPEGVEWNGKSGFVNKDMLEEAFFPPSATTFNMMCGPPIMMERAVLPNLKALGHEDISFCQF